MPIEPWQQRFLGPSLALPEWAADVPDRLLYASDSSGAVNYYAWDRARGSHVQVTQKEYGTRRAVLDPTGHTIWYLDDHRGGEYGTWGVRGFYCRHPEDTRWVAIPPAYSTGIAVGRDLAVIGTVAKSDLNRIYLVSLRGSPRVAFESRACAFVAGLSADDRWWVLERSDGVDARHTWLTVFDRNGAPVRDLADGHDRALRVQQWSPVAEDPRIVVLHERYDQPRPLIWNPLTGSTVEVKASLEGAVEARWYPDGRALLLLHHHRGLSQLLRYSLDSERMTALTTLEGTIDDARVRPDGAIWYSWSSSVKPPEVRADDRVLLRAAGEQAPDGVRYDHHQVAGVHVMVARARARLGRVTAFFLHGGPAQRYRDDYFPEAQAFVDHGMHVVLVNYRGSSGSGRAFRDSIIGRPGLTELDDVVAVRCWAIEVGLARPDACIVHGTSWGGYVALLALGVRPDLWAGGIAAQPLADPVEAQSEVMPPIRAMDRMLFGGSPAEVPNRYQERSPMTYAGRVRAPLLILAGENDPRCPISQVEAYVARLENLGHPPEVYRYESGHQVLVKAERLRQAQRKLAFCARHFGTRSPAGLSGRYGLRQAVGAAATMRSDRTDVRAHSGAG